MGRCVIVGSADIINLNKVKSYIKDDDFIVFCDGGLRHKEELGLKADYIVGDFDSYEKPENAENILILPTVKDDTDTVAAVKLMLEKGFKDFLIIGAIGQRLDHSLGNVSILIYLKENAANGVIVDDYSEMKLITGEEIILKDSFSYFSIISLDKCLKGVYISGAKYPLENAVIENSYQYGISNEPTNDTKIRINEGNALLIKVF